MTKPSHTYWVAADEKGGGDSVATVLIDTQYFAPGTGTNTHRTREGQGDTLQPGMEPNIN